MSKDIKQFSVWEVDLGETSIGHEQRGKRPFFVLSSNHYNNHSRTPIGFTVSSSESKSRSSFAIKIELDRTMSEHSHVNISQIRTLDKSRFKRYIGKVEPSENGLEAISKFISKIIFDDQFDSSKFLEILKDCKMEVHMKELCDKHKPAYAR